MKAVKACLVAMLLLCSGIACADVAVPDLTGRVVDQTGTLDPGELSELDAKLRDFEARKGSQVAVLLVPTTDPETIEQFSIRVAEAWKIGRKKVDDGAILLVAKDDRKLRIEVGYGLEGVLTDATSRRIIDEIITPRFKSGDFAGGITAGVDQILKVIDGEQLPPPQEWRRSRNTIDVIEQFAPFLLIGAIFVGGALRAMFGPLVGSTLTGGIVAVVVWFIAGLLSVSVISGAVAFVITLIGDAFASGLGGPGLGGGRRGGGSIGGYPGGGSWSSGSSSSSDSGGFSGGGGSFGGGGASGSW